MNERPIQDSAPIEDVLARFIRFAGEGRGAPSDVRARIYASVHASWKTSLGDNRRRRLSASWLAAAAVLAPIAVGLATFRAPARAPGAELGSVRASPVDERTMRVPVREGVVRFRNVSGVLPAEAGDDLLIAGQSVVVRARIGAHGDVWVRVSQLAGVRRSVDYSAAALLAWISRETGRPLRFDSPATQAHAELVWIHGAEGLSPLETLNVVVATTDLRYEVESMALVIHVAER